jgi:hypothetical protein
VVVVPLAPDGEAGELGEVLGGVEGDGAVIDHIDGEADEVLAAGLSGPSEVAGVGAAPADD